MEMILENHKDGRATLYRKDLPFIIFPSNQDAKDWVLNKYGDIKLEEEDATPGMRFYSPPTQITEKQKFARSRK